MTGVRECAIIAASNVLSSASGDAIPALQWAQGKQLWAQVRDLAISFYTTTPPLALHRLPSDYYALSVEDRWHFFDRQLHLTSKPEGSFISPFSRPQVEKMINAYLKSALEGGWKEQDLEHVFGCRNFDDENTSSIRHNHTCLIAHIQAQRDLGIQIPEAYIVFKKAFIPIPKAEQPEVRRSAAVAVMSSSLV
jgi:hypothetical protein